MLLTDEEQAELAALLDRLSDDVDAGRLSLDAATAGYLRRYVGILQSVVLRLCIRKAVEDGLKSIGAGLR